MTTQITPHKYVGRFAPSPTGPLHFGSLVTAIASYCLAKQQNGQWLIRIDDLDQPRVVTGMADKILHQLEAFGLHWDGPITYQSNQTKRYAEILDYLDQLDLTYPCWCSRKEILASAPHFGIDGPIYPRTCLNNASTKDKNPALRLKTTPTPTIYQDDLQGCIQQILETDVGDFTLCRGDGVFSYQLAVVVDDHDSGITHVVRGRDLLASTPRQIYLFNCLDFSVPCYTHLLLALDPSGEKISKRHHQVAFCDSQTPQYFLYQALRFLGQSPPLDLINQPTGIIINWAIRHFSIQNIPVKDQLIKLDNDQIST
jgi:glutamyl-Q tRNA(Asp) synthetase